MSRTKANPNRLRPVKRSSGGFFKHVITFLVTALIAYNTALGVAAACGQWMIDALNLQSFGGILAIPVAFGGAALYVLALLILPQLLIFGLSKVKKKK